MIKKEDLLVKKLAIDAELSRLKAKLNDARRIAAAKRIFLPLEELRELENSVHGLARKSQAIQNEITKIKAAAKQAHDSEVGSNMERKKSNAELFMRAAYAILDDDLLDEIRDEAGI